MAEPALTTSEILQLAVTQVVAHERTVARHRECVDTDEAFIKRATAVLQSITAFGDILGDIVWATQKAKPRPEVKLRDELAVVGDVPAQVEVLLDGEVITRVTGEVAWETGADGGNYPVVKLTQVL